MIVVDTSALAAVVFGEPDATQLSSVMAAHSGDVHVSAATLVECAILVEARQGPDASRDLDLLLDALRATVVPLDSDQSRIAIAAWQRFGKGRHPASLNLGDCYSYALAAHLGAPLLYKGDDFSQTDIARA